MAAQELLMRRTWSFLLILLFMVNLSPMAAQEEDQDSDSEDDIMPIEWDTYVPDFYRTGDRTFTISAGLIIPTFFVGKGMEGNSSNINLGGMGSLGFNYFLNANWFVGAELGGMFAATGGRNMLFIIPFGPRFGYQFVINRFEIPLTLMIGAAPQRYLEKGYFGLIIKPGVSGFYRFNADWSFGLNSQWWILPQSPANGKDVVGNFLELSLTARYHF
jgi:hypothetical protein